MIAVKLKDGQTINIDPKTVKLMTHSRHASRKIGTYAALAIVSPLFLPGMLKKNKRHFIGIATEDAEGRKNGSTFRQRTNNIEP